MSVDLTDVEVRVLGALIEKDMTTPDYTRSRSTPSSMLAIKSPTGIRL